MARLGALEEGLLTSRLLDCSLS